MSGVDGNQRCRGRSNHGPRLAPDLASRLLVRIGRLVVKLNLDGRKFGIAICKDMGFPRFARRYGREGIDAMLTPAWDFVTDAEYHARIAVLRGREQGFSVIRTANQGVLTV